MNDLSKHTDEQLREKLQQLREQEQLVHEQRNLIEDELSRRVARESAARKMAKLNLTDAEKAALEEMQAEHESE